MPKRGGIPHNKGKKKSEWKKTFFIKICPTCKKEIKTTRRNQIYCDLYCYSKSPSLKDYSRNSSMIKGNAYKKYHLGFKHSEFTKNKIRDNQFRHSFIKGGWNPGKNKSQETIFKIKEKRLHQRILKKDTKPEKIIQQLLKDINIKFIKHKPILNISHKYQCDIFIEPNIVIECDGDYYHKYPEGRDIDRIRTKELEENGYKVLRFWENEIKGDANICKTKILEAMK